MIQTLMKQILHKENNSETSIGAGSAM